MSTTTGTSCVAEQMRMYQRLTEQWWFLHEQGDRAMCYERVALGEAEQICWQIGARTIFEKKIQDKGTWKIYKRAYKNTTPAT